MPFDPSCPDCNEKMEFGFIPDATYGAVVETHWHPGTPKEAKFFGISSGTVIEKARMIPVRAWRCPKCGLLRVYAKAEGPRPHDP